MTMGHPQHPFSGRWNTSLWNKAMDPSSKSTEYKDDPQFNRANFITIGSVFLPEPEPVYKETSASVDLFHGGILTGVAWPGAQVDATVVGLPAPGAISIHGLFESPLPGQQVVVGFIDGKANTPVVLAKQPYTPSQRPDLGYAAHTLPLTQKAIGPTDVVLGHHTGCFIALRGTLPIPSELDIFSPVAITQTTLGFKVETIAGASTDTIGGAYTLSAGGAVTIGAGAAVAVTAGAAVSITAGAALSLTAASMTVASAGPIVITAVPAISINGGVRPVAALGDLTPTLLGPSPIAATGISMLV